MKEDHQELKYRVTAPLDLYGQSFRVGSIVELSTVQARRFQASGQVSPMIAKTDKPAAFIEPSEEQIAEQEAAFKAFEEQEAAELEDKLGEDAELEDELGENAAPKTRRRKRPAPQESKPDGPKETT